MWAYNSVFYQIYPIGFCGAPRANDGVYENRIKKVIDWIPHIKKTGADAVYFSPVFESDSHGYNTRDFYKLDLRLGNNEDFKAVCDALHENGIKVVLDGVFNHVGRGFWAFQDVIKNKWNSPYRDWFFINFDGNSAYNDGFWYEGWEGHFDLVKLNLRNGDVIAHIFDAIKMWVAEFGIDGLRLDVAYQLDFDFLRRLRSFCDGLKSEFFLLGELLHGDYNRFVNDGMLHSATNYECYKGLFSSFNSMNMFEICHSLKRQYGPEQWTLYRGKHLLNFVDNHDVTRIADNLTNKRHLPLIYALMFGMPGIPCLYYGSEWGASGKKSDGDDALRPSFDAPKSTELTEWVAALAKAHKESRALCHGDLEVPVLTNKQCVVRRNKDGESVLIVINADGADFTAKININADALDILTGKTERIGGEISMPAYSARYLKLV